MDGTLSSVVVADPLTGWDINTIVFDLSRPTGPVATVTLAFRRQSGLVDQLVSKPLSSSAYEALTLAINTSSGNDEALLVKPDGSPDIAAILRLRVARFISAHPELGFLTSTTQSVTPGGLVAAAPPS